MRGILGGTPRKVLAVGVLAGAALVAAACKPLPTTPIGYEPVPVASWRTDGVGLAALLVGDVVYIGGEFSTVTSPDGQESEPRANLAAFDARTGALLAGFDVEVDGAVQALAHDGHRLFVGGEFTAVDGVSRARLAAVDPVTGDLDAWKTQSYGNVYALAVGGSRLFVGGSFTTIAGAPRTRVAAFDLSDAGLGSFAPAVDGTVSSLTASADGDHVFIGGAFATVDGQPSPWLAHLDGQGALVPTDWEWLQGEATGVSLSPDGTHLAVSQAGGGNQASYYDLSSGERLWRQRCDGDAQAVHVVHGTVVGGFHEACEGDDTIRLTANDRVDGARDVDFAPTFDRYWGVWGIDGDHTVLVVAGDVTEVSGVPVGGFAIFPRRTG